MPPLSRGDDASSRPRAALRSPPPLHNTLCGESERVRMPTRGVRRAISRLCGRAAVVLGQEALPAALVPVRLSRSWNPSGRVPDRAQHDPALVRSVVAGAAVHDRALVPEQDIAAAPAVSV